jgi:hypothetical protein
MRYLRFFIPLLLLAASCAQQNTPVESTQVLVPKLSPDTFRLSYTSIGLGSNFGGMQPVFRVVGSNFIYTMEQTGFYEGSERQPAVTICYGSFRASSADSIIALVGGVTDTMVYRTNPHIMSGGIHYIHEQKSAYDVTFQLHNTSDPVAQQIVDILNTYVPATEEKLWLWDIPKCN